MTMIRLIQGDCRDVLPTLAERSVQAVITSPPYYGLRRYDVSGAQIGLEATIDAYVAALVEVFQGVRRVLRDDGTFFLNIGDCYGRGSRVNNPNDGQRGTNTHARITAAQAYGVVTREPEGLKQLLGIPWRVAFALQADGWILRSDIIWSKPNPMPESVRDRPTKSHEYLFMFARQGRYFYDSHAIREPIKEESRKHFDRYGGCKVNGGRGCPDRKDSHRWYGSVGYHPAGRNRRSVWTVASKPFKDAHFATFPVALVDPCVRAGTSEKGCCPKCLAPWVRVVERPGKAPADRFTETMKPQDGFVSVNVSGKGMGQKWQEWRNGHPDITTGWRPSCTCPPADPIPCTVLDCFAGACSAGVAAVRRDRRFVGVDLNARYLEMGRRRLVRVLGPLFANLSVEG